MSIYQISFNFYRTDSPTGHMNVTFTADGVSTTYGYNTVPGFNSLNAFLPPFGAGGYLANETNSAYGTGRFIGESVTQTIDEATFNNAYASAVQAIAQGEGSYSFWGSMIVF
jgi:hypothetical protein